MLDMGFFFDTGFFFFGHGIFFFFFCWTCRNFFFLRHGIFVGVRHGIFGEGFFCWTWNFFFVGCREKKKIGHEEIFFFWTWNFFGMSILGHGVLWASQ